MGKEGQMDEHGDLNEKKHVDKENLANNMWNLTEKKHVLPTKLGT